MSAQPAATSQACFCSQRVVKSGAHSEIVGPTYDPVPSPHPAIRPWPAARLADILAECEPRPSVRFVWSTGADYGEFGGVSVEAYVKDLPRERVKSDVLLAYEMNGEPLTPEHGSRAPCGARLLRHGGDRTAWLGMSDSNSEMSLQIIPLKGRKIWGDPAEREPPLYYLSAARIFWSATVPTRGGPLK
jgi:Oxidoreductase molybdopterin binding domain